MDRGQRPGPPQRLLLEEKVPGPQLEPALLISSICERRSHGSSGNHSLCFYWRRGQISRFRHVLAAAAAAGTLLLLLPLRFQTFITSNTSFSSSSPPGWSERRFHAGLHPAVVQQRGL